MATSGIESLFNLKTPEEYQQEYLSGLMVSPAQMGQQSLYNQIISTMANAGAMGGVGIGRMLGGRTSQEVEAEAVNSVLKDISAAGYTKDSEKYSALAAKLEGLPGMAGKAAEARKLALAAQEKEASIAKSQFDMDKAVREQQQKEAAVAGRIGNLNKLYKDDPSVTQGDLVYGAMDDETYKALLKAKEPQQPMDFGDDYEAYAKKNFGKRFSDLSPQQAGTVISQVDEEKTRRVKAGVPPAVRDASAVVNLTGDYARQTEAPRAVLNSARTGKDLINEAATTNNSQTWEAARTTIAKAVGENKLSNEDIRRTGVDPRLVQGALDWVNKKVAGVPNADVMRQLYTLSTILEKRASDQINSIANYNIEVAKAAGMQGNLNVMFPGAKPSETAGGVVDFNSLKRGK